VGYYALKIIISAILIVAISEIGKRSSFFGAILASLPLTSILAISWLYFDTKDVAKVMDLSIGIFWVVLPSLVFFLSLFLFIKNGVAFLPSMFSSVVIMSISYTGYIYALEKFEVKL